MAGKLGRNFLHNSVGISTWGIVTCIMGLSDVSTGDLFVMHVKAIGLVEGGERKKKEKEIF